MNRNNETKQADSASQPRRSVLRGLVVLMGVAVMIVVPLQRGFADDDHTGQGGNGANPYAFGLWGDLPYSSVQATVGVPNLTSSRYGDSFFSHTYKNSVCDGRPVLDVKRS